MDNGTRPEWTRQIGGHSASRTPPGTPARRPPRCMLHLAGLGGSGPPPPARARAGEVGVGNWRGVVNYTAPPSPLGTLSARAVCPWRACPLWPLRTPTQHGQPPLRSRPRSTAARRLGPGTHFRWQRVKFLETTSSPRPSNFRENSGKFVTFFPPSADGPSARWSRETVVTVGKKFWI